MTNFPTPSNEGEKASQSQPEKYHQYGGRPEGRVEHHGGQDGEDGRGHHHQHQQNHHDAGQNPETLPPVTPPLATPPVAVPPAPTPKRLPRYKRAPTQVPSVLTRRDLDIIHTVQSFRLLTSAHIQSLAAGSNQGVLRRLQKLFHAGYLDRLSPRTRYGEGTAKMVYAVTNKGILQLQKAGLIEQPPKTDLNFQNRSLHDFSIGHTLLISHIRAVLTLACKHRADMRLLFWKEGRSLQDSIEVALPAGYQRIPVAPDAYFALQDAQGRSNFFHEADRGTMTTKRFHLKLKAYAAYWQEKKHQDKFGIKKYRVLVVTTGAMRAANLAAAVANDPDLKALARMFLFTHESMLTLGEPESVFKKIWTIPGNAEPHSILG
jgi:hypothetical protein